MRRTHNLAALGLAAVMAAAGTFPAVAGSPEFAYTEEKWASLRDNILEYDEIPDLVHEYNPTVLNQLSPKCGKPLRPDCSLGSGQSDL